MKNTIINTFKIPPTFASTSAILRYILDTTVFLIFSCLIYNLRNSPSSLY